MEGERQNDQPRENVTQTVEDVDAADLPGKALCHEGGAPDDGDEEEGEIGF